MTKGKFGIAGLALLALLGSGCSQIASKRLNLEGLKSSEQTEIQRVYDNPEVALKVLHPETREYLKTYSPNNLTEGQKQIFNSMGIDYITPNLKELTTIGYIFQEQAGAQSTQR